MKKLIETLKKEIQIAKENGCGWRVGTDSGHAIIDTRYSDNPHLNANGGDYDYWTRIFSTGNGVYVRRQWSADFDFSEWNGNEYDFYPVLLSQSRINALVRKLWNN